jgi:hypothetical protein
MTNITYCVACAYTTDNGMSVCTDCSNIHRIPVNYVPTVCGDSDCYLDHQGMPNFDGDCNHYDQYIKTVFTYA